MKCLKSFVLVLASAILLTTGLAAAQENLKDENGGSVSSEWSPKDLSKAYVLLAWGAPSDGDGLQQQCADGDRKKLENAFEKIRESAPDRVFVKSLINEDASHSNLYAECYRIAQEADVNDAVFVYVLTPTATLIGKESGICRNVLTPLASSALRPDVTQNIIQRKTIRNTLSSRKHRLEALLVDVAPTCILSAPYRTIDTLAPEDGAAKDDKLTYLARFLLEGKGTLDVSSARPYRGEGFEDAFAWVPSEWSPENASDVVDQRSLDDRLSGTLFCNALLSLAETVDFTESDFSADAFAAKLADSLQMRGEEAHKTLLTTPRQTLTRFGRKGSEILVQESEQEE